MLQMQLSEGKTTVTHLGNKVEMISCKTITTIKPCFRSIWKGLDATYIIATSGMALGMRLSSETSTGLFTRVFHIVHTAIVIKCHVENTEKFSENKTKT